VGVVTADHHHGLQPLHIESCNCHQRLLHILYKIQITWNPREKKRPPHQFSIYWITVSCQRENLWLYRESLLTRIIAGWGGFCTWWYRQQPHWDFTHCDCCSCSIPIKAFLCLLLASCTSKLQHTSEFQVKKLQHYDDVASLQLFGFLVFRQAPTPAVHYNTWSKNLNCSLSLESIVNG